MSAFTADDHRFMARAQRLAARGLYTSNPNPRVGCVLVRNGNIVGEGFHQRAGGPHAEIFALQAAGTQAEGATAYVTLEPCHHHGRTGPCSAALINAGVKRVVQALPDPNPLVAGQGLSDMQRAGIDVASGLLREETEKLNAGFLRRMREGLPWIRLKMALSLDGRTGMRSGESQWITGPEARHDVQLLRTRSGAIVTGVETVIHDDPSLNVRLTAAEVGASVELNQPVPVVLDSQLRLPLDSKLLSIHPKVLVFHSSDASGHRLADHPVVELIQTPAGAGGVDLKFVFQQLAQREVNECHVECGATLAGQLLQQQLLNEMVLYLAPTLLGSEARGLFNLSGLTRMAQQYRVRIEEITPIGQDWRMIARP